MAFLISPKLRSKGRFQSISKLGKWADKMLEALAVKSFEKDNETNVLLARLRVAMPDFFLLKPFIIKFAKTTEIVSKVMKILKKKGLTETTYRQCKQLSTEFPEDSKVKIQLQDWLEEHLKIQQQTTRFPLIVSSDIIESLFGNFKHIIARGSQGDMNRSALLIPALCGNLAYDTITEALIKAPHCELKAWDKESIPYTIRKERQKFFDNINIQKTGK
jgi:hypothetical protein